MIIRCTVCGRTIPMTEGIGGYEFLARLRDHGSGHLIAWALLAVVCAWAAVHVALDVYILGRLDAWDVALVVAVLAAAVFTINQARKL